MHVSNTVRNLPSIPPICWLAVTTIVLLTSTGCATIINGSTQEVSISSNPTGARVDIDGDQKVTTPTTVKLKRKKDHVLTFELDGYESETFTIRHGISGAVAGNILAGGLIGWGVDAASGGQYKLIPSTVQVHLRPATGLATTSPSAADTLQRELQRLGQMRDSGAITTDEYTFLRQQAIGAPAASSPSVEDVARADSIEDEPAPAPTAVETPAAETSGAPAS